MTEVRTGQLPGPFGRGMRRSWVAENAGWHLAVFAATLLAGLVTWREMMPVVYKNLAWLHPHNSGITIPPGMFDPSTLEKFVDELPLPSRAVPLSTEGSAVYNIDQKEALHQFHRDLHPTRIWGYDGKFPGPTFDVTRGSPTVVTFTNQLPSTHLLPIDSTLHGARHCPDVRTVVHLHGAQVEAEYDGYAEDWTVPEGHDGLVADERCPANGRRHIASSATHRYGNEQRANHLFYHDHALGITRLNVYAGLVGFYFIRDHEEATALPTALRTSVAEGGCEVPLLIQDRALREAVCKGQTCRQDLFYPSGCHEKVFHNPGPDCNKGLPNVSVIPEWYGIANTVNGKIWPYMHVEAGQYRLRVLNGANARYYRLRVHCGSQDLVWHQIGADGGLFSRSMGLVTQTDLLLEPGARADVIVDFSSVAGSDCVVRNHAPDGGCLDLYCNSTAKPPADPDTSGVVMMFRVSKNPVCTTKNGCRCPPSALTGLADRLPETLPLDDAIASNMSEGAVRREFIFQDMTDPAYNVSYRHHMLLHNDSGWKNEPDVSCTKRSERWVFINPTSDPHPIHVHQANMRVLRLSNGTHDIPVPPSYQGIRDIVNVPPSNGTEAPGIAEVLVRFDRPGRYMWHCHMLEHEDNEMMRPLDVRDNCTQD